MTAPRALATLAAAGLVALALSLGLRGVAGTQAQDPDWGFNQDWVADPTQVSKTGQGPNGIGATTNRLIVRWRDVERDPPRGSVHSYDWSAPRAAYDAMLSAGETPVLTLEAAPDWARAPGWQSCPEYTEGCEYPPAPTHDGDWREFVHQAITQFPQALAIEVWNEPNFNRFWYSAPNTIPDVARYADVLHAARLGASDAGTSVPVITGGLSPGLGSPNKMAQADFLTALYQRGSAADFTGIGEHVYPRGAASQQQWVTAQAATINELRSVRDGYNNQSSQIWVTEVGVSTASNAGSAVSETDQGPTLAALYRNVGSDVKVFLIHQYQDTNSPNANTTDIFGHMGVVHQDLTPKPALGYLGCDLGGRDC